MKRSTPEHPKLLDLCARLKLRRWQAVGILESIWHFTVRFAPQGDIGRHSNHAIAHGIDWRGDATRLIQALICSGWIDECPCHRLTIHDWSDHADQTLRRFLASNHLAFVQHGASTKKPAQPNPQRDASPPCLALPCLAQPGSERDSTVTEEAGQTSARPPSKTLTAIAQAVKEQTGEFPDEAMCQQILDHLGPATLGDFRDVLRKAKTRMNGAGLLPALADDAARAHEANVGKARKMLEGGRLKEIDRQVIYDAFPELRP